MVQVQAGTIIWWFQEDIADMEKFFYHVCVTKMVVFECSRFAVTHFFGFWFIDNSLIHSLSVIKSRIYFNRCPFEPAVQMKTKGFYFLDLSGCIRTWKCHDHHSTITLRLFWPLWTVKNGFASFVRQFPPNEGQEMKYTTAMHTCTPHL